jgi:hypothetical protein
MKYEKKVLPVVFLLLLALLVFMGCGCRRHASRLNENNPPAGQPAAASHPVVTQPPGTVLLKGGDGYISFYVPSSWNLNDTTLYHGPAVITASDRASEQYLVVTSRGKTSSQDSLNNYINLVKTAYSQLLQNMVWGNVSSTTLNGYNALTVEVSGQIANNDNVYWITAVDAGDLFYCISGYTRSNLADQNKQAIANIIDTCQINVP